MSAFTIPRVYYNDMSLSDAATSRFLYVELYMYSVGSFVYDFIYIYIYTLTILFNFRILLSSSVLDYVFCYPSQMSDETKH